jgi:REP element-mobilizing transposase RayT
VIELPIELRRHERNLAIAWFRVIASTMRLPGRRECKITALPLSAASAEEEGRLVTQSLTNLLYHIVFSTKHRQPMIAGTLEDRLHGYLGGLVRGQKGIALEINGTPDHVHILAKLSQNLSVAEVLREIKALSSGWVHREFPAATEFGWQLGYAAFTVSESQVDHVRRYIRNQKEHHAKVTFQEELISLLRAHGVEFNEQYLWR